MNLRILRKFALYIFKNADIGKGISSQKKARELPSHLLALPMSFKKVNAVALGEIRPFPFTNPFFWRIL